MPGLDCIKVSVILLSKWEGKGFGHKVLLQKNTVVIKILWFLQVFLFWGWVPVGDGRKERVNEGEYGGCILHSSMKIEE
jgi:hypothetical protein